MKTLLKLLVVGAMLAVGITSCIDHDWDLSKTNTDNVVVADTLIAPLGYVKMTVEYLTGGAGGAITGDPVIDQTFSYEMHTTLDQTLANALISTDGKLTLLTTIENQTNAAFDATASYVSDEAGKTVLVPTYPIATRNSQQFELDVTIDEFKNMVGADRLEIHLTRTDTGNITIASTDYMKVTFAIRKIGGLKLNSLL